MNKVEIVGALVRDPQEGKGSTRFTVAAQRNFKNKEGNYEADFINCVAFGKTAEIVNKWFKKGSKIGVIGRINTGSYTNKDGNKVYTTDVAVESIEFIGSKSDSQSKETASGEDGFMNLPEVEDDEMIFK